MVHYWKEMLLVLILTCLGYGLEAVPSIMQGELVLSSMLAFLSVMMMIVPILAAIPAGFLIGRKTEEFKPAAIYPGMGAALAAVIMLSFSLATMIGMSDAMWQMHFSSVKDVGVGLLGEMSLEEYKMFTITATTIGLFILSALNFALGLLGGFIGRWLHLK